MAFHYQFEKKSLLNYYVENILIYVQTVFFDCIGF